MGVAVATAIMILVNAIAGGALLRVAFRTRKAPELLIGIGLIGMGPVSQTFMVLSGMGRVSAGEVDLVSYTIAAVASTVGMACIFLFVRKVFRPRETWALALTAAAILLLLGFGAAGLVAMVTAPPDIPSSEAIGFRGPITLVLFSAAFGWASLEAGLYHARMRKQAALGLADPVVANRFLLWAVATGAAFLLGLFLLSAQLREGAMSTLTLVPSVAICVVSLVTGTGMVLAFLPPQSYVAWVRARARQSAEV